MPFYIVDTYAWLEYFGGNEKYQDLIEKNNLKTPVLVLAELKRSFMRKKIEEKTQDKFLLFVESVSYILPFKIEHAIKAGELAEREKLPLSDAIIYLYASHSEELITGDEHFKGKSNVLFIKG